MKIIYDYQIFSYQQYGGISRYVFELSRYCARQNGIQVVVPALAHKNRFLRRGRHPGRVIGFYVPHLPKTSRPRLWLNRLLNEAMLACSQADIIHHTYYGRLLTIRRSRRVYTVHDMIHERFPEETAGDDDTLVLKPQAIQCADHLICVSNTTRDDLSQFYGIEAERTSVVHLGHGFDRIEVDEGGSPLNNPYLLFVGQRDGYKNFHRLLEVFAALANENKDLSLVCYGEAFREKERLLIDRYHLTGRLHAVKGGDRTLKQYYRHAAAFVFPSMYEGFGIPVLEAMASGCPVVCSRGGSLPEVAGDAAEYFDPLDEQSMQQALRRVIDSPGRTQELVSLGTRRAKLFSWERCGKETVDVYRKILGRR